MMSNLCAVCQNEAAQTCSACGQIYYCSKNHQKEDWKRHKNYCCCYKIRWNERVGRCVIASRNIKPGEIIMKKHPILLAPKTVSYPICLGCHKKINPDNTYKCSFCFWPLCGKTCESSRLHAQECGIFAKNGFKPTVQSGCKQSVYSTIGPLRALLLKKQPKLFEALMDFQAHLERHLATPVYQLFKKTLVPFLTQFLELETTETEILTICSIFDTNCFDVRDAKNLVNIRGLYPTVSLLSHDCQHNTKHSFIGDNYELILTATCSIKKGELITATYTQTLWNTMERRAHLQMAKQFDCCCKRCKDPTEFNTYIGSIICLSCQKGKVVSLDPLNVEADWKCNFCGLSITAEEIAWRNQTLKNEIANLDKTNPENLEQFLEKYKNILPERNSYCLQVKYALCQMYGNLEGFKLEELSDHLITRKINLTRELLEIAEILEGAYSRFRGCFLLDLHEALMIQVKKNKKNLQDEARKVLQEAADILKTESDLGEIVQRKLQNEFI